MSMQMLSWLTELKAEMAQLRSEMAEIRARLDKPASKEASDGSPKLADWAKQTYVKVKDGKR